MTNKHRIVIEEAVRWLTDATQEEDEADVAGIGLRDLLTNWLHVPECEYNLAEFNVTLATTTTSAIRRMADEIDQYTLSADEVLDQLRFEATKTDPSEPGHPDNPRSF